MDAELQQHYQLLIWLRPSCVIGLFITFCTSPKGLVTTYQCQITLSLKYLMYTNVCLVRLSNIQYIRLSQKLQQLTLNIILRKQHMLKKKSQLKLNSYKIDTNQLQTSLKQLSEIKSQLQTTIQYYKQHESQLLEENDRLKQQIQILQNKAEVKADHSQCRLKILKLETQLREEKKDAEKYKRLQQSQKRAKDLLAKQYESKLEKEMKQSRIKSDKYQQRLAQLYLELRQSKIANEIELNQNKTLKQQLEQSMKSLKMMESKKQLQNNMMRSDSEGQSLSYMNKNDKAKEFTNKYDFTRDEVEYNKPQPKKMVMSGIPPKSPNYSNNRQFKSFQQVREISKPQNNYSYSASYINTQEEQIFSAQIRKLYAEMKDMGLSCQQIQILPQFKKMKQNSNPSKKDLINLFKNPPFDQQNQQKIIKSANYLENIVKNKHGKISGKFITQVLIARVEQYENSSKIKTEDIEISGVTPSASKEDTSNHEAMPEKDDQYRNYSMYDQYVNKSRPSIQDHLRIQSEGSFF